MPMPHTNLGGKLAIITGANSGIGNKERAEDARGKIVKDTGNHNVEVKILDCGTFASVYAFLNRWAERKLNRVDILINNAGGPAITVVPTEDGFERTYQSNHLAHILLTHTLLNRGHFSPDARIVSVSSSGFFLCDPLNEHNSGGGDILSKYQNQVEARLTFKDRMQLYFRSKASQAIWSIILQRRLSEMGKSEWKGITVHACHPGTVKSPIWSKSEHTNLTARIFWLMGQTFGLSIQQGAILPVWLAVAPTPASEEHRGKYWDRMRWKWLRAWSLEVDRQEKLWNVWCKDAGAPLG